MNETSPKPSKGRAPTPLKQVERMYQLFVQEQSVTHIARECGSSPATVRKYIEKGDPARKVRPFRQRRNQMLLRLQNLTDEDIAKRLSLHIDVAGQLLAQTFQRVQTGLENQDINPSVGDACMVLREHAHAITLVQKDERGPSPLVHIDFRGQPIPTESVDGEGSPLHAPPAARLAALRRMGGMTTQEGNFLVQTVRKFAEAVESEELLQQDQNPRLLPAPKRNASP